MHHEESLQKWVDDGGSLINPPSGWYFTKIEFSFDEPLSENIIMVGNAKYWEGTG